MPFMPGRLMSMSTTSGAAAGRWVTACSAEENWPTQEQTPKWSTTRASLVRTPSSSSTMATLIGTDFFCREELKDAESAFILAKTGYAWDCESNGEPGRSE